ncbi:MAG: hypothetical protein JKY92_05305 [Magnetovibrio sp.]|nr:hypothetical protein [Magnetovibrio sp.]
MFRIDLDRFACRELIENLSSHTSIPYDDLWARTLQAWAGRLFDHDAGHNKLIWLPPAGAQRTRNFSISMFALAVCKTISAIPLTALAIATLCKAHGEIVSLTSSMSGAGVKTAQGLGIHIPFALS